MSVSSGSDVNLSPVHQTDGPGAKQAPPPVAPKPSGHDHKPATHEKPTGHDSPFIRHIECEWLVFVFRLVLVFTNNKAVWGFGRAH